MFLKQYDIESQKVKFIEVKFIKAKFKPLGGQLHKF